MNDALIENYIETQYQTLINLIDQERLALYSEVKNEKLRLIFSTLHKEFEKCFTAMNGCLPTKDTTAYYWADYSRSLKMAIEMTFELQEKLKGSESAFEVEQYYFELLKKCSEFLVNGGSTIPPNTPKVTIYLTIPIFIPALTQNIERSTKSFQTSMKLIGEGSYAKVFKCRDEFFDKGFAIKRALGNLNPKEMDRFKLEFDEMKKLSSPYILEVYKYDAEKNQYYMELMDSTLDKYISTNNGKLSREQRVSLVRQALRGLGYLHSKGLLHRDISPSNVLVKIYDDVTVLKISDFGLVKTKESKRTAANTEPKGALMDPVLRTEGWANFDMTHEVYAITLLVYFIMTGRTDVAKIQDKKMSAFVSQGLYHDRSQRYQNIDEITAAFNEMLR